MRTPLHCILVTAAALLLLAPAGPARADILYVGNHAAATDTITKITSDGIGSVFAHSGVDDPFGLAFDGTGLLFAANTGVATSIRKFDSAGVPTFFANSPLSSPRGIAFDAAGNLYVANSSDGYIARFTPAGVGSNIKYVGGPHGLAFDATGDPYISKPAFPYQIVKLTPDGTLSLFTTSLLSSPEGLAFDSAGNLFVANKVNKTIVRFAITDGVLSNVGSVFASTGLNEPYGLAFDSADNLYVGNLGDNTIAKFTPVGVGSVFADASDGLRQPAYLAFTDDNGVPLKLANQRPIPEPSSLALLGLGLPALLGARRTPHAK